MSDINLSDERIFAAEMREIDATEAADMIDPDRIYVEHDEWRPPRVGFAPSTFETEPLLWDGDQA